MTSQTPPLRYRSDNPGLPQFRVQPSAPQQEGDRIIRFVASDETPDRVGDIIKVSGWNLTSYKQNPVVLWGHDQANTPPIGKAVNVRRGAGPAGKPALLASIEFAPKEAYEFAETVYQLTKGGFLNAVSVGFMPRDTKELSKEERAALGMPSYGLMYTKADLLEISVVSVPANPSALVTGAKGLVSRGLLGQREVDRFLKDIPMTEEELAARLKAKIRGFVDLGAHTKMPKKPDDMEEEETEKAPLAYKVGDMVSWDSSGGRAKGKIERIETDGTIEVPESSFKVIGTPEDPAALIRLYDDDEPLDTMVGHKFSALRKLSSYGGKDEDEKPGGKEDQEKPGDAKPMRSLAGLFAKHVQAVVETEDSYIVTYSKDSVTPPEVPEASEKQALANLVAAQTEQAKALSTLVDSISDLTKRIHSMGEVSGEGQRRYVAPSDAAASDAQRKDLEAGQKIERLTADFLGRLTSTLR